MTARPLLPVASLVRELRLSRGWSVRELAWRADVMWGTIIYIESGRTKNPGLFTVQKILRACGYDLFALRRGSAG